MSTAELCSFVDEVTRPCPACLVLRRASRIKRIKHLTVRTLTVSYLTVATLALAVIACQ